MRPEVVWVTIWLTLSPFLQADQVVYCRPNALLPVPHCPQCSSRCGETATSSQPCSCDSSCVVYGDCCRDFRQGCPAHNSDYDPAYPRWRVRSSQTTCKEINNALGPSFPGILLLSGCADDTPCLDSNRSSWDAARSVPVMETATGLHYINAKCAVCNAVREARPWNVFLDCSEVIQVEGKQTVDKVNELIRGNTCKVYYEPPKGSPSRFCRPYDLSTCNHRTCGNPKLVALCHHGPVDYTEGFRNYFCALCATGVSHTCGEPLNANTTNTTDSHVPLDHFSWALSYGFDPEKGLLAGTALISRQCPKWMTWSEEGQRCLANVDDPNCSSHVFNIAVSSAVVFDGLEHAGVMEESITNGSHPGQVRPLGDDLQSLLSVVGYTDGKLRLSVRRDNIDVTSTSAVIITSSLSSFGCPNSDNRESALRILRKALQSHLYTYIFDTLAKLEIKQSSVNVLGYEDGDWHNLQERPNCGWKLFESSQYAREKSLLILDSVTYDQGSYELFEDMALVCVEIVGMDRGPGFLVLPSAVVSLLMVVVVVAIAIFACRIAPHVGTRHASNTVRRFK